MQKILHSFHKSEPELEVKETETFQSLPLKVLHCEDRAGTEALAPFLMVSFLSVPEVLAPLSNLGAERAQLESMPLSMGQSTHLENESCGQTP